MNIFFFLCLIMTPTGVTYLDVLSDFDSNFMMFLKELRDLTQAKEHIQVAIATDHFYNKMKT